MGCYWWFVLFLNLGDEWGASADVVPAQAGEWGAPTSGASEWL